MHHQQEKAIMVVPLIKIHMPNNPHNRHRNRPLARVPLGLAVGSESEIWQRHAQHIAKWRAPSAQ